ncbi:MAG: stage III sporulation protein AE [Syntrophomonadaceae bacterium]|nr:stage III sporulation protein AE [Syntrophomonadaceae bacterium]
MKRWGERTKRAVLGWLLLILVITLGGEKAGLAAEQPPPAESVVEQQLRHLDFGQVEKTVDEINRELNGCLPALNWRQLLDDLRQGRLEWNLGAVVAGMARYLFREAVANSSLLGQLVILAVVCAVLQNLRASFEEGTVGRLAHLVCYLALVSLALGSFLMAAQVGREALGSMVKFIQVLVPLLLTMMAAVGGFSSAALLHPFIAASLGVLSTVIGNIVFPLIFLSAVLGVVNQLSDQYKVSRLAEFLKKAAIWTLGLAMTLFIGMLSIRGVMGAVGDSVTLRAAKFATGTFVPVVGGAFAEAINAVIGYSLLLKNSVGIVGMIVLLALCLIPAMKILAVIIVFKLAAILVQPLGDDRTGEAISVLGSNLGLILVTVAGVGIMFFMTVAIILGAGNLTVMLR